MKNGAEAHAFWSKCLHYTLRRRRRFQSRRIGRPSHLQHNINGRLLPSVPVPVRLPVRLLVTVAGLRASDDDDVSFGVSCSGARLIAEVSPAADALSSRHSVTPSSLLAPSPMRHRLPRRLLLPLPSLSQRLSSVISCRESVAVKYHVYQY